MFRVPNLILFVDDEALLHLDIESAFASAGLRVASALSFDEADQVIAARRKEICALVTDVDLGPGFSGWVLARLARRKIPRLPVVYASGGGGEDFETEGVANARFVSKPYSPAHIARVTCAVMAET